MSVAVLKFKDLGINEFVRDLELTELANHIAAKLRDMTGKKRKDVHGKPFEMLQFQSIAMLIYLNQRSRFRAPTNHRD